MESQQFNNQYSCNQQYSQAAYPNYYYNSSYYENPQRSVTPPSANSSSSYSSDYSSYYSNASTGSLAYTSPNNSSYYSSYNMYSNTNSTSSSSPESILNYQSYPYSYYYSHPSYYNQYYNQSTPVQQDQLIQSQSIQATDCLISTKSAASRNIIKQLDEEEDKHQEEKEEQKSKRRIRTQFSIEQRRYLLSIFEKNIYPSKEVLEVASKELNVTIAILQTWFKNTRSKQKKLTHTKNL